MLDLNKLMVLNIAKTHLSEYAVLRFKSGDFACSYDRSMHDMKSSINMNKEGSENKREREVSMNKLRYVIVITASYMRNEKN